MGIPEEAVIRGAALLEYIPQRAPMVLVDAFYGVDGPLSESGYTVPEDGLFTPGGYLDECALIEHMAQSAALRVGYLCKSQGKPVPLGFIGAVAHFKTEGKARPGNRLRTKLKIITELMNITLAEAEVFVNKQRICSAQLKIFLQE